MINMKNLIKMKTTISKNKNYIFNFYNSSKKLNSTTSTSITQEEVRSKINKNNTRTVTMGFPDLYGRYLGKKYDADYFVDVCIYLYTINILIIYLT